VASEAGDFRQQATSPCVDAGVNEEWMFVVVDIGGNPRIFNGTVDMGAYEFTVTTEARVILQGAYRTNNMAVSLQNADDLPGEAPYADDTREATVIPTNTTDWVLLALADTNDHSIVSARSALLRNDGQAISDDGNTDIRLECSPGHYYLVAKHRNHLAAMSAQPVAYTNNGTVTYDFTTNYTMYMGGSNACVQLDTNVWGMIAGDADGDGEITEVDRLIVSNQLGTTGYLQGDLDLDGKVDAEDLN